MIKDQLLKPLEFRFTDPEDVKLYGDEWHRYDELRIAEIPAQMLMAIEIQIGGTIVSVMNGIREDSVFGNLAGSWLALKLGKFADQELPFRKYNPRVMLMDWRDAPEDEDEGKATPGDRSASPGTIALEHADTDSSATTEAQDSPTS